VRVNRSDHIVQAIPIDVIDQHLRCGICEVKWVFDTDGIIGQRNRLLPPAVFLQDIDAAVAVDIAAAYSMRKTLVLPFRRNRMELPRSRGIFPISFRISNIAFGAAKDFRFSVTRHIKQSWRLIVEHVQHDVAFPRAIFPLRIFIPGCFLAREAVYYYVRPSVLVEVIGIG